MKKYLHILTVLLSAIIALTLPSPVEAKLIFSDTFKNGYDHTLWSLSPGQVEPAISDFGIKAGDPNNYSSLVYSNILPKNLVIKVDMKINSSSTENPATDMGIFIHDSSTNIWKNIFLFGVGFGGSPNTAIIRDSSIWADPSLYMRGNWDTSVGLHHIEIIISGTSNTPITIIEDGNQVLTWTSNLDIDFNQITFGLYGINSEFANFMVCDSDGCPTPTPIPTQTPTPTPESTPTPINTPTPTPTSTPSQLKKVVFLHGMGGSWNTDALLNCKTSGYSGAWSPWTFKNYDVYKSVLDSLRDEGYTVLPYYYDWRKTTTDTAQQLKQYIQNKTSENEPFDLVGHSFGGLVGRAYINNTKENSRVDTFLTIGTPHFGSVFAYPAWSGGEMLLDSTEMRLGFTIMKIGCAQKRGILSSGPMVRTIVPSIQNLLPTFDYLKNKSGQIKPVSSMETKNNWLPDTFMPPYYGITIGTITGVGYKTLKTIQTNPPNRLDSKLGNWKDGKPTDINEYSDGDGTVLATSSQLPEVPNTNLTLDHTALITHPTGINTILQFLNGEPVLQPLHSMKSFNDAPIKPSKGTTALFVAAEGSHFTLTDKDGNQFQDSEGQITIIDPLDEAYTLHVVPTKKWWWHKTKILVVQLFEDGTSKWKQYVHPGGSRRRWKLGFDRKHRHEDILRDR